MNKREINLLVRNSLKLRSYDRAWKQIEHGHSMLFNNSKSVIRPLPKDPNEAAAVSQLIAEWRSILLCNDVTDYPVSLLDGSAEDWKRAVSEAVCQGRFEYMFHEGYLMNSEFEARDDNEALAKWLREEYGIKPLLSPGKVADQWHCKPWFRQKVKEIHGRNSVPEGIRLDDPEITLIISETKAMLEKYGKIVIKVNFAGGLGNLIVTKSQGGDLETMIKNKFARQIMAGDGQVLPGWVSLEQWVPWVSSGVCSFFSLPDEPMVHMEFVEQVLSMSSAGFIGSRSFTGIPDEDRAAIIEYSRPIAQSMKNDGIVGFCGVDFTITRPTDLDIPGIILPSGNSLHFIEATARMGGHNQEMTLLDQLACRDGLPVDSLVHMRIGTARTDLPNRGAVKNRFKKELSGLAKPLTRDQIRNDRVYYLVDECFGQFFGPSMYDAIFFIAFKNAPNQANIMHCFHRLKSEGLTRLA